VANVSYWVCSTRPPARVRCCQSWAQSLTGGHHTTLVKPVIALLPCPSQHGLKPTLSALGHNWDQLLFCFELFLNSPPRRKEGNNPLPGAASSRENSGLLVLNIRRTALVGCNESRHDIAHPAAVVTCSAMELDSLCKVLQGCLSTSPEERTAAESCLHQVWQVGKKGRTRVPLTPSNAPGSTRKLAGRLSACCGLRSRTA
jgi:hypothetical protein